MSQIYHHRRKNFDISCFTLNPYIWNSGILNIISKLASHFCTCCCNNFTCCYINNILGKKDVMRYNAIPGVVYTNPEVAGVGLTEAEAKAKGIDYKVAKLPMAYSGRFVAENEGGEGICKLIVGARYHEILGAHMLGNPCSEILQSMCIAIEQEMTIEQIKEVVFPHPTVGEIIKETAFSLK